MVMTSMLLDPFPPAAPLAADIVSRQATRSESGLCGERAADEILFRQPGHGENKGGSEGFSLEVYWDFQWCCISRDKGYASSGIRITHYCTP